MSRPAPNPWRIASPCLLAFAFILLFWNLDGGSLDHVDELLTAERSRELALGYFPPVHFNFSEDHNKPPLQYLATAGFQILVPDPELSVRLFPVLCAAVLLLLLYHTGPALGAFHPAFPALALLAFLAHHDALFLSRSGLLDSGNAFFILCVILTAWHARRGHPAWWWAAAAMAGTGFLHKNALPLLVYLAALLPLPDSPSPWRNRHWWGGLVLALLLALSWPLLLLVHPSVGNNFEYLLGDPGADTYDSLASKLAYYPGMILERWRGFSLLALAAILALPFAPSWRRQPAALWLALTALLLFLAMLLPEKYSFRYAYLPCIPLIPLTALFLLWCKTRMPPRLWGLMLALLILSTLPGWTIHYLRTLRYGAPEKEVVLRLASHLSPETPYRSFHIVRLRNDKHSLTTGHMLYYARLSQNVINWNPQGWHDPATIERPALGLASLKDWPDLQAHLPGVQALDRTALFVVWELR